MLTARAMEAGASRLERKEPAFITFVGQFVLRTLRWLEFVSLYESEVSLYESESVCGESVVSLYESAVRLYESVLS